MLLRLQPCARPLILVLLVQTMLGLVLVEAVPATRAPGGRRRSTTTTTARSSTATPTAVVCVDPSTTTPPTTGPAEPAGPAGPPTTSLAATNSTWPRQWVGPPAAPPTPAAPPPGGGGGGNVKDNLVEDEDDSVTCYTCVNVSDNIVCNKYAIDVPCPKGEDFCHTLHIVDSRGESVLVNKKCAVATECDPVVLGCLHIDTQTVCASCCDESYCNETVPTNRTTSFYSSTRARAAPAPTGRPGGPGGSARPTPSASALAAPLALWLAVACARAA